MTFTASKVELAWKCPGAFALPHFEEKHAGQDEGNERHVDQEAAINVGDIPEVLAERWPGYTWRAEVSYAIDVATGKGRELGAGIARAYDSPGGLAAIGIEPLSPFEISGTSDAEGRGPAGELVIVDRKSFDPNVSRASKNAQLHTLGLAATRAFGLDECEVAIHHEARALDVAPLDFFNLEAFQVELQGIHERVAVARSKVREGLDLALSPGPHCRWCPAFMGPDGIACPAQKKIATLVRSGDAATKAELIIPLADDESAAEAYLFAQQLGMLLKRLNGAIYARAAERPIPLPDGRMFGPVTKQGNEQIDAEIAYRVVREKHGQEIADAAVARSASKASIERAMKLCGGKGKVAALQREVLEVIKANGGTKREPKTEIESYVPQQMLRAVND